ncbi:hypothetical protein Acr_00g0076750 [Actinidia rufa]|uniref:UBN2_3 domain-containing protein n=1 Tax=Actinidia rufa TaxID=165716 RepID=A0A7J0DUW1_9ERIC|nr:hypothetical protein Acr_00g0076750 [Actinidia rufa]
MQRFLRTQKFLKYITSDVQQPHSFDSAEDDDDDDSHVKYRSKLKDWNNDNSKIITWFSNTSVPSNHFEIAKEVWDYLAEQYSSVNGASEYYLGLELHHLRFELAAFYAYRDGSRLSHFLMAFPPDYEYTWTSLLYRHPLPTLGQALLELRSEETRKKIMVYHQYSQHILVIPSLAPLPLPFQPVQYSSWLEDYIISYL